MTQIETKRDGMLTALGQWYQTPVGKQAEQSEVACVERMLENAFGHFVVQIGCGGGFCESLERTRIRTRVVLCERSCPCRERLAVHAQPSELPFDAASIDALIMPHTLDFSAHPQRVLREAERVLIPEGRLIVIGFNPFSTWGLIRGVGRQRRVPWSGNQLTSSRLIDWLNLLGFQLELRQWLLFRPPWRSAYTKRLDWIEESGARWWPMFGGAYVIRAVKRVSLPTHLRPSWKVRPRFIAGGAVKPTAREGNHAG